MRRVGSLSPRSEARLVWAFALVCGLGWGFDLLFRPGAAPEPSSIVQVIDVGRTVLTLLVVLALLVGPGLLLRAHFWPNAPLAAVPVPGLAWLTLVGGLGWLATGLSAGGVPSRAIVVALLLPTLAWVTLGTARLGLRSLVRPGERFALCVMACVAVFAVAKALWSLGPVGELYGGTISRTLEVGDRSDSRISYHVAQLVAHGINPLSRLGQQNFLPYNFSSRGPISGMASASVLLFMGGRPPIGLPTQPWLPFDPQGFAAYREAMIAFACCSFAGVWSVVLRLAGLRAARFAVAIAATTPFLVHEVWFTWPKLLAGFFVLLAFLCLLERHPFWSGLLAGVGYLVHPIALLSLPILGLFALWPLVGARLRRPRIPGAMLLAIGAGICLIAWRLINLHQDDQAGFLQYVKQANRHVPVTPSNWIADRIESLANTLVPLRLFFFGSKDPSVNSITGPSPAVIHFFFQYWNTLPFGFGIFFFPLLLVGLWRFAKRHSWPLIGTVVLPFVVFAIYWGAFSSGLMREGLQIWALTLVIVLAIGQEEERFRWSRSGLVRGILYTRALETFADALVPAISTQHRIVSQSFLVSDVLALVILVGAAVGLIWALEGGFRPVSEDSILAERIRAEKWIPRHAARTAP